MFCSVATCKKLDIKSVRMVMGNYELSEEEDLEHKKMLVLSSMGGVENLLDRFRDALATFSDISRTVRNQCGTPLRSDRLNLGCAREGLDIIRERMKVVRATVEAEGWRKA